VLHAIAAGGDPRTALNRAANELAANISAAAALDRDAYGRLVLLETTGKLNPTQAKDVLVELLQRGGDPAEIAAAKGYEALSAEAVAAVVDEILAAHPTEAERLRGGDPKMRGFFVGKIMEATAKKADGRLVNELLAQRSASSGQ